MFATITTSRSTTFKYRNLNVENKFENTNIFGLHLRVDEKKKFTLPYIKGLFEMLLKIVVRLEIILVRNILLSDNCLIFFYIYIF